MLSSKNDSEKSLPRHLQSELANKTGVLRGQIASLRSQSGPLTREEWVSVLEVMVSCLDQIDSDQAGGL